jgi:glycosyltransferase involved in cell wall biosynthesis
VTGGPHVVHLVAGPADHGVVRFAVALAGQLGHPVTGPDLSGLAGPAQIVHLQYTDALHGTDTATAATAFTRLVERIRLATGARPSVTLHDLPDPADEPGRYARRAESYRRVAAAVDLVTVSSDHEAALLETLGGAPGRRAWSPVVVPLPIDAPVLVPPARRPVPRPEVAVFGFLHPGKGHADVLAALAESSGSTEVPPDLEFTALEFTALEFTALGRTADGHDDLGRRLQDEARAIGRRLRITGFLPDHEVTARLQRVAVPIAPARMVSASGSINTWITAGRRPLVARSPYTDELSRRYPGSVRGYAPDGLAAAIRATLADPGLSWLADPRPDALGPEATARAYRAAFAEAAAGADRVLSR